MKFKFLLVFIILLSLSPIHAQITSDTLNLEWEASVNYGNSGQTTVLVDDTLWHFGGVFAYGLPFDVGNWDYSYVEYMSLADNYWEVDTLKTLYRMHGNTETYNGYIYLFGGYGAVPEAVEVYHPASKSLFRASDLPNPRRYGGSALYEGKIYLVGGANTDGYSNLVDIYDIATDSWTMGASFPIASQTDVVVKDGIIYALGGYGGAVYDEIFMYDIASDSWSQAGVMPEATSAHTLAIYDNFIYVLGDYADLERIMRYNISDGSWVNYESNMIGRRHASATIANDKLYYVSGNASRSNGTYQRFRIVQSIDLSDVVSVSEPHPATPATLSLKQNFPNPFNPSTSIQFSLSEQSNAEITIYNIMGQTVRELSNRRFLPGEHKVIWDGRNDQGQKLASGQYFYSVKSNSGISTRKMVMLR